MLRYSMTRVGGSGAVCVGRRSREEEDSMCVERHSSGRPRLLVIT